jgi:probable phosphoglycerate mutase
MFPSVTLLLIRHGQQQPAKGGAVGRLSLLSGQGRLQADLVASALAAGPTLSAVYSSDLPRAVATAEAIGHRLALIPVLDPRLAEFEMGTKPLTEIAARPDLLIWRPDHRGGDGETLRAFCQRVAKCCEEIVERHAEHRIVIVSHAGTMDAAFRWALGMGPDTPWQHELEVLHASITEVEVWPHGRAAGGAPRYAVIHRVNDTAHLGALVTDF